MQEELTCSCMLAAVQATLCNCVLHRLRTEQKTWVPVSASETAVYQAHCLSSGARPELSSKTVRRACQEASLLSPCSDTSDGLGLQGVSRSDMLLH